jgi:small-conductance mechanosensitive channel
MRMIDLLLPLATATTAPSDTLPEAAVDAATQPEAETDWLTALWNEAVENDLLAQIAGIAVTLVVAVVIYIALGRGLRALLERNHQLLFLGQRLLRWIFIPLVILLVLQQMGVRLGNLWTVVSTTLAMVAIGFVAVWSVLSNVSATFMIFSPRLFGVGDEIEILDPAGVEGLRGRVIDLNLIYTTIEQATVNGSGRIVTKIPNNIFFQKSLRIRSGGAELAPKPGHGNEPELVQRGPEPEQDRAEAG